MAVTNYERVKFASVPANSVVEDIVTPPNGKTGYFKEFGGCAANSQDVKIEITFGEMILFATHGTAMFSYNIKITGDGVKQLKIRLVNDTVQPETIGGYYKGIIY